MAFKLIWSAAGGCRAGKSRGRPCRGVSVLTRHSAGGLGILTLLGTAVGLFSLAPWSGVRTTEALAAANTIAMFASGSAAVSADYVARNRMSGRSGAIDPAGAESAIKVESRAQQSGNGSSCQRALASDSIRNMDEYLRLLGVAYGSVFDEILSDADCTVDEIAAYLVDRGADNYGQEKYESWQYHVFRYRPFPIPAIPRAFIHIAIVGEPNGSFRRSSWSVGF